MIQLIEQGLQVSGEKHGDRFVVDGRYYRLNANEHLIPEEEVPSGHVGWMYDGVTVDVQGYLYKAHTRAETMEENDLLST